MKCKTKRQHEPSSLGNRLSLINEIRKNEEQGNTARAQALQARYNKRYGRK